MGLYFKIIDGLKLVVDNRQDNTLNDDQILKRCLTNYMDQCTSFLQYLKNGNEDYGQTRDHLKEKYTFSPADFNNKISAYNNVVTQVKEERERQLSRALMFDCLFKQAMIFIDEVLNARDSYGHKERQKLSDEIIVLKRELEMNVELYEQKLKHQKDGYEQELNQLKKMLYQANCDKIELHEIIKDRNFTLNGLFNIERRSEAYEELSSQLRELEDHLKNSEEQRRVQFNMTNEVMNYINIAGGMIPKSSDKAIQAGNPNIPITASSDKHLQHTAGFVLDPAHKEITKAQPITALTAAFRHKLYGTTH